MEQVVKSRKITYADKSLNKDVIKVSFFILFTIIVLYVLTIAIMPVYAR